MIALIFFFWGWWMGRWKTLSVCIAGLLLAFPFIFVLNPKGLLYQGLDGWVRWEMKKLTHQIQGWETNPLKLKEGDHYCWYDQGKKPKHWFPKPFPFPNQKEGIIWRVDGAYYGKVWEVPQGYLLRILPLKFSLPSSIYASLRWYPAAYFMSLEGKHEGRVIHHLWKPPHRPSLAHLEVRTQPLRVLKRKMGGLSLALAYLFILGAFFTRKPFGFFGLPFLPWSSLGLPKALTDFRLFYTPLPFASSPIAFLLTLTLLALWIRQRKPTPSWLWGSLFYLLSELLCIHGGLNLNLSPFLQACLLGYVILLMLLILPIPFSYRFLGFPLLAMMVITPFWAIQQKTLQSYTRTVLLPQWVYAQEFQKAYLEGPVYTFLQGQDLSRWLPHLGYVSDYHGLAKFIAQHAGLTMGNYQIQMEIWKDDQRISQYANGFFGTCILQKTQGWVLEEQDAWGSHLVLYHGVFPLAFEGKPWAFCRVHIYSNTPFQKPPLPPITESPQSSRRYLVERINQQKPPPSLKGMVFYRVGNRGYAMAPPGPPFKPWFLLLLSFFFFIGVGASLPYARIKERSFLFYLLSSITLLVLILSLSLGLLTIQQERKNQIAFLEQKISLQARQIQLLVHRLNQEHLADDPNAMVFLANLIQHHIILYSRGMATQSTIPGITEIFPSLQVLPGISRNKTLQTLHIPEASHLRGILVQVEPQLHALFLIQAPSFDKASQYLPPLALTLFILGLGLMVAQKLAKPLASPLEKLTYSARQALRGKPLPVIHTPIQEVQELTQALQAFQEELRQVILHFPLPVCLFNAQGEVIFSNSAFHKEQRLYHSLISGERSDRRYLIHQQKLPMGGKVVVVEDVSRALEEERLQAFLQMAQMVAHEVKNPLTPLRLSLDYLNTLFNQNPEKFQQVFRDILKEMYQKIEELREMATNFSIFARLPHLQVGPFKAKSFLEKLLAPYQRIHPITLHCPEDLEIHGDEKLLKKALENLILNALQSADPPPPITIKVEKIDNKRVIHVCDEGPGLPVEVRERIFEPYFTTKSSGTGLGLAITARIIQEHSGTITAKPHHPTGTCFTITLPAMINSEG